jgi:hypothetical protein
MRLLRGAQWRWLRCTQSEPARHRPPRVFLAAQRIKVKGALFNEIATQATERVMADFSCAWTKRTSHWPAPMSQEAPVRFRVSVVVAALILTGCNANQAINPSSQPPSQAFAGHYVDYNPYDPISYAQNNTGRGGGR